MSESSQPANPPQFTITVRGYDRGQVENYLGELHAELEHARHRISQLEDTATADELRPPSNAAGFRALGEHIGKILELADLEARSMRERAAQEAQELLTRARAEAEEVIREQEQRREQVQQQLRALHETLASAVAATVMAGPAGREAAGLEAAAPDPPAIEAPQHAVPGHESAQEPSALQTSVHDTAAAAAEPDEHAGSTEQAGPAGQAGPTEHAGPAGQAEPAGLSAARRDGPTAGEPAPDDLDDRTQVVEVVPGFDR